MDSFVLFIFIERYDGRSDFNAFQFSAKDDTIMLDVDKETLKDAPGFDKDNWPLTADQDFIDSIYHHYGYERQYPSQI